MSETTTTADTNLLNPTRYVVLRRDRQKTSDNLDVGSNAWRQVEEGVNATSAHAAIRDVVSRQKDADAAGTYVAVPARSWRPVTVKAVQTTVLKLEDA